MKNKKSIIILVCLLIIFIVFAFIGLYINYNPKYKIDSENRFKNFMINIPKEINYERLDNYSFRLKTDEWRAIVEPIYDEYNHIMDYPKCTQKYYDNDKYNSFGDIKRSDDKQYYTFQLFDGEENNIILHYKLPNNYVMFVAVVNNDNSFDEKALETILEVLKTVQFEPNMKFDYHSYSAGFYHQCHDIDQYDKDEVEQREKEYEKLQEEYKKQQEEIEKRNESEKLENNQVESSGQ